MTNMQDSRSHITIKEECKSIHDEYTHDLQMYVNPPSGNVKLENLQQICLDRLKVRNYRRPSVKCKIILRQELHRHGLFDFAKLLNAPGCASHTDVDLYLRRMDHISHFLLRSAFAFKYKKKLWFFKQEVRLFKWRVSSLNIEGINRFIDLNKINYSPISDNEREKYQEELSSVLPDSIDVDSLRFYKMPFSEIPRLVAKRKVFLKDGIALVPEVLLGSLFITLFKRNLCSGFQYSREIAVTLSDDVRITAIFKEFPNSVQTRKLNVEDAYEPVTPEELDELAVTSFPLCMRMLHEALKTKHHLTNGGRLQYCLFLKGIGVNLANALRFWKTEFMKKIDEDTFNKRYRYNIRHLYGVVGSKYNYKPRNCWKILDSTIGPRDNHGCPFKHMSSDKLAEKLLEYGLPQSDVGQIIDYAKETLYMTACTTYFESTHNCYVKETFFHPNSYFNESRKIRPDLDNSNLPL